MRSAASPSLERETPKVTESIPEDGTIIETSGMAPRERVSLVNRLREQGASGIVALVTKEWLAEADFTRLVGRHQAAVRDLVRGYSRDGVDDTVRQESIRRVAAALSLEVTSEIMRTIGMDPDDYAIMMVGSAARGEMFPGSDIDLLIVGDRVPDPEVNQKVRTTLAELSDIIVKGGYERAGASLGEGAVPFKLDACLGTMLFHTTESVIHEATVRAMSSDNMIADTMLLNSGSRAAVGHYTGMRRAYDEVLDEAPGIPEVRRQHMRTAPRLDGARRVRDGFLPERLVEMREKILEARGELHVKKAKKKKKSMFSGMFGGKGDETSSGSDTRSAMEVDAKLDHSGTFDVKKGLLRAPSLLARDFYTFRSWPDPDPATTLARLESFKRGPRRTRLTAASADKLANGFRYGTALRMKAHIASGGEMDYIAHSGIKATVKGHLAGYVDALNELIDIAKTHRLAPRHKYAREVHDKLMGNVTGTWRRLAASGLETGTKGLREMAKADPMIAF